MTSMFLCFFSAKKLNGGMFDGSRELVVPTLNPGKRTNEKETKTT